MQRLYLLAAMAAFACASANTAPGSSGAGTARISGGAGDAAMRAISTGSDPIAGETVVAAPARKLWNALPGVYDSLGIGIGTIDPPNMLIGNRGLQIRRELGKVRLSKYIDCGSAQARPSADFYDVNMSVVTQLVRADTANTKVVTTVDAMARPVSFTGEYIRCATTGEIESRISRLLEAAATR
jgi:hypothetical protein